MMTSSAERQPALRGINVLVVDDDGATLEETRVSLAAFGASVDVASSGADALNLLEFKKPDVILLDLGMPEMDGFTVAEEIRKRPSAQGGSVPIAALSGYISSVDQTRAFRSGVQAYLVKPADPDELVAAVLGLVRIGGSAA